jgi:hypothetical protein
MARKYILCDFNWVEIGLGFRILSTLVNVACALGNNVFYCAVRSKNINSPVGQPCCSVFYVPIDVF